jgi:cytochrome c-type biogenesis protein CcmE
MSEHESRPISAIEVSADNERGGVPPIVKVAIVFTMLGGALTLLLFGSQASDALVYSKLVDEVLTKPSDFRGRELRVEGDLKQGSIQFREDPCEYRFVLGKPGKEMPVRFPQCIVPDTFKDGVGLKVTVQGKLTQDGYFLANQVIAKCPSKYEMNERAKQGEAVPHAMPNQVPAG